MVAREVTATPGRAGTKLAIIEELRRRPAGVFPGAYSWRYYRYRHPGSQGRDNDQDGQSGPTCYAPEPNGAS